MNQTVLQYNNFGFTFLVESDLSFPKFCHRKRLLLNPIRFSFSLNFHKPAETGTMSYTQ